MEYRLYHHLSKFDRSVFVNLKPISHFFGRLYGLGFLSRNYWSWSHPNLMASIWEKVISILAGNLNSGRSYFITAVLFIVYSWLRRLHCTANLFTYILLKLQGPCRIFIGLVNAWLNLIILVNVRSSGVSFEMLNIRPSCA